MISRLVDWYLRRRGERRAGKDDPMVIIQRVPYEVPIEVIKEVEVPVEVEVEVYRHPVDIELVDAAGILTAAIEHTTHDGEWKRHQVYAHLIKHYPDANRRDIALAIEYALREFNV